LQLELVTQLVFIKFGHTAVSDCCCEALQLLTALQDGYQDLAMLQAFMYEASVLSTAM
jgi:hypothetical protein